MPRRNNLIRREISYKYDIEADTTFSRGQWQWSIAHAGLTIVRSMVGCHSSSCTVDEVQAYRMQPLGVGHKGYATRCTIALGAFSQHYSTVQ